MGRGNIETGRRGESIAAAFLKKKGYRILSRNLRTPFGELDIVARLGRHLVFIEVKTRNDDSLGPPSISVTWYKRESLVRNALWYLAERGLAFELWRIDVVAVKLGRAGLAERIDIIENAVVQDGY
jgi:putative endonuclease